MGLVHADIELINSDDLALAKRNIIGEEEVRRMRLDILVDTGSYQLAINETLQEYFQFRVLGTKNAQLADGRVIQCDEVGPVELVFKNRSTTCRALVLPADCEPLLGVIPLEGMDVLIDPLRQQLIVNPAHPDYAVLKMK